MIDSENLKKRLFFQSQHRGTKENDLLLGPFAAARLVDMPHAELALFDEFLQETDQAIYGWLVQNQPSPDRYQSLIVAILRFNEAARHVAV